MAIFFFFYTFDCMCIVFLLDIIEYEHRRNIDYPANYILQLKLTVDAATE